jgi:hypothetical protein
VEDIQQQREKWDAAFSKWKAMREAAAAGTGADGAGSEAVAGATPTDPYPARYHVAVPVEDDPPPQLFDEQGQPLQNLSQATLCGLCNVYRIRGTAHCYDCNSCILELDHHCPWTGKCIGKHNLKPFYAFLWAVTGSIVYVIACVLTWLLGKVATNAIP